MIESLLRYMQNERTILFSNSFKVKSISALFFINRESARRPETPCRPLQRKVLTNTNGFECTQVSVHIVLAGKGFKALRRQQPFVFHPMTPMT